MQQFILMPILFNPYVKTISGTVYADNVEDAIVQALPVVERFNDFERYTLCRTLTGSGDIERLATVYFDQQQGQVTHVRHFTH